MHSHKFALAFVKRVCSSFVSFIRLVGIALVQTCRFLVICPCRDPDVISKIFLSTAKSDDSQNCHILFAIVWSINLCLSPLLCLWHYWIASRDYHTSFLFYHFLFWKSSFDLRKLHHLIMNPLMMAPLTGNCVRCCDLSRLDGLWIIALRPRLKLVEFLRL